MSSIGLPSQGFFNFLIFIRPRYITSRKRFPDKTRFGSLLHAIWFPTGQKHHQNWSSCALCERLVQFFIVTKSNSGNITQSREEAGHGDVNAIPIQGQYSVHENEDQRNSPFEYDSDVDDTDNNKTVCKGPVAKKGKVKTDFFWESGHFCAETGLEANDDVDDKKDSWVLFR
jgi:hypothetical protein